jgi:hypothetical protein
MVFQNDILAGSSGTAVSSVYKIDQSIRINDDDNAYLSRTLSTASDAGKTYTWSWWQKLGAKINDGSIRYIIHTDLSGGNNADYLYFNNDDFQYWSQPTGLYLRTDRKFRDPSAWYHFLFIRDTTQAIESERLRLYVNGIRETSFSTESYPALNSSGYFNTNTAHYIGGGTGTANRLDSYMAEIHFLDGYAYDPSYFGLFNENGVWIPKEYSGSYGTNGFKIDGRDASDLGDDESGNGNDFVSNNLTASDQVLDSPTNNFAVANPLHASNLIGSGSYAEGNLQVNYGTSIGGLASIAVSSGKWYAEWEIHSGSPTYFVLGIYGDEPLLNTSYAGKFANSYGYYSQNGSYYNNNVSNSYGDSYTVSDIIGIALDLDNNKLYFSKNGTFQNSGVPTSGSTGTGAISITSASSVPLGHYFIAGSSGSSAPTSHTLNYNFGQDGTFAGNVTAGGNSDANGVGNFKYSVPSGYLALCTKNLGS